MKSVLALLVVSAAAATAGCGVESAGTAATAAAVKQKEIEAGQKTKAEVEKQVGQAMEQMQQNVQRSAEAGKQ